MEDCGGERNQEAVADRVCVRCAQGVRGVGTVWGVCGRFEGVGEAGQGAFESRERRLR